MFLPRMVVSLPSVWAFLHPNVSPPPAGRIKECGDSPKFCRENPINNFQMRMMLSLLRAAAKILLKLSWIKAEERFVCLKREKHKTISTCLFPPVQRNPGSDSGNRNGQWDCLSFTNLSHSFAVCVSPKWRISSNIQHFLQFVWSSLSQLNVDVSPSLDSRLCSNVAEFN